MFDAQNIFHILLHVSCVCTYYMHLSTKNPSFTEGMAPQPFKNHKYNKLQFILVCVCLIAIPMYQLLYVGAWLTTVGLYRHYDCEKKPFVLNLSTVETKLGTIRLCQR